VVRRMRVTMLDRVVRESSTWEATAMPQKALRVAQTDMVRVAQARALRIALPVYPTAQR
jgi:hypothetical protein